MSTNDDFQSVGKFINDLLKAKTPVIDDYDPLIALYANHEKFFQKDKNGIPIETPLQDLTPNGLETIRALADDIICDASWWNYRFESENFAVVKNGFDYSPKDRTSLNGFLGDGRQIHDTVYIETTNSIFNLNPNPAPEFNFNIVLNNNVATIMSQSTDSPVMCHIIMAAVTPLKGFKPVILDNNVLIIPPVAVSASAEDPNCLPEVDDCNFLVQWTDPDTHQEVCRNVLLFGYININLKSISLSFIEPRKSLLDKSRILPLLSPDPTSLE